MQKTKKATIREVACLSGVGIATVSRVINGNYPVSEAVRADVWKAINTLNYRPNIAARSLKTQKSKMAGVIVADLSNLFFMQLVKGLEKELSAHGYNMILAAHDEDPGKERELVEMLLENNVAAIVTTTCQTDNRYFASLKDTGVPIILVDRVMDGLPLDCISEDNEDASFRAVRSLTDNGHRRIAVVNGLLTVSTAALRYSGYLRALREADIPVFAPYIVDAGNGTAYPATLRLFSLPARDWPTAMFCTNNRRAEGALRALKELDLSVPRDISMVSYGDISLPWLFSIRLTHVHQDLLALGRRTGELTVRRIEDGGDRIREILRSELIIGDSVRSQAPE
jgi:DNA-binding LacI/PurR family transcriptional regulator